MLFEAQCVTRVSMTLSVNVHLTVVHVAPGSPEEDRVHSEAQSKTPDTTSISHSVLKQAHIVFGGRVMKQVRVYMILVLVLIVWDMYGNSLFKRIKSLQCYELTIRCNHLPWYGGLAIGVLLNVSLNSANSVIKHIFVKVIGLEPAISCVRDQDATTAPGAWTCHLLCERPGCYHSTSKTHVETGSLN